MRLNSKQIAEYTGATVIVEALDPSHLATSITFDSREVAKDSVYVALPGNRVDGHDFIVSALEKGACIVLTMKVLPESTLVLAREMGAAILEVASTRAAFTDLARAWRKFIRGKVIALTGSTGKTTTKNLVRDVLSTTFKTVATHGNQNNELGVPKTLLEADPETDFVVVEMGMRGLGQLKELCDFVRPDYALITNVGTTHIELLGSREAIAQAKSEVLEALPAGYGRGFVNADDEMARFVCEEAEVAKRNVSISFFDGSGASQLPEKLHEFGELEAWVSDIEINGEGRPHFVLHLSSDSHPCTMNLRGAHNVFNACACAALAAVCGVDLENICHGLEASVPEVGRQEILQGKNEVTIINDAYNANPDSMRAALSMFSSLDVRRKRYAVLGDMGELGDFAPACHEGVGQYAAGVSLDYLICVGELAALIAKGACDAGFPADHIVVTKNRGEALNALEMRLEPGDAVLVKASRFMELERIVRGLID